MNEYNNNGGYPNQGNQNNAGNYWQNQGNPQNNGYPNNGYPNNGYPNNGYPNNGYPNNGYPNNGYPNNGVPQNNANYMNGGRKRSKLLTTIFCYFFGAFGVHRFYTGKIGTGILWLLTCGLCGWGTIIDLFVIMFGSYKDKEGNLLKEDLPNWVRIVIIVLMIIGILSSIGLFIGGADIISDFISSSAYYY